MTAPEQPPLQRGSPRPLRLLRHWWSPDGSRIVFSSDRDGHLQIHGGRPITLPEASGPRRTIEPVSYWSAKSDLEFMAQFRLDVFELWKVEGAAANRHPNPRWLGEQRDVGTDPQYQMVREKVTRGMSRAVRLGRSLRVPFDLLSYPAPITGGPVIDVNLFESVLKDTSHGGVDRQWVIDSLNRTVGAAEEKVRVERRHALNPAWWLWSVLVFVLRIPFILLSAAGFNTAKFEDELWAKLLKAGEVILIMYFAVRWGVKANIVP